MQNILPESAKYIYERVFYVIHKHNCSCPPGELMFQKFKVFTTQVQYVFLLTTLMMNSERH